MKIALAQCTKMSKKCEQDLFDFWPKENIKLDTYLMSHDFWRENSDQLSVSFFFSHFLVLTSFIEFEISR